MSVQNSKALLYVQNKGWDYRTTDTQIIVTTCPVCQDDGGHFYISFEDDKDGMWHCFKCAGKGNLYSLMEYNGDKMQNVVGLGDMRRKAAPLPNIEECHKRLVEEFENSESENTAMDYLVSVRHLNTDIVDRFKLGLITEHAKRWLVIPHFVNGQPTFAKFRTLPPDKKEFRGVAGREQSLFNQDCLAPGMDELIIVEGEMDTISCVANGIEGVVGAPGANVKKRAWIQKLDDIAPKKIYLLYDNDQVGQIAAQKMAMAVGIEKALNIVLPEFTVTLPDGTEKRGKDINDFFASGHTVSDLEELKKNAKPCNVDGVQSAAEVIEAIKLRLSGGGTLKPKYVTQWDSLNRKIGGFDDGDLVGIIAEAKIGKMQPLSAKVLTPTGWVRMKQLRVGDAVASVDGKPSVVDAIIPHGIKPSYRVTFSDGRSTLCGDEHLWKVGEVGNFTRDGYRVVDTLELQDLIAQGRTFFIPTFSGDYCSHSSLPMSPWLLGALLGDGGLTNGTPIFTKDDPATVEAVREEVARLNCHLVYIDGTSWRIVGNDRGTNKVADILLHLNLLGKRSEDKSIPMMYLNASRQDRLALLTGLMDTDGSAEGSYGIPCFNTSSPALARDVKYLVRSLGGIATSSSRVPTYQHNGEKRKGLLAYRVYPKLADRIFRHSYKASREVSRTRSARLKVISVVREGYEEMQCISVSHPDHLYVTDEFIVTHNTTLAMNLLDFLTQEYEEPGMMYCQEMRPDRLVTKWISYVTDTEDKQITLDTVEQALTVAAGRKADYLFAYTRSTTRKEVFDTIRQAVRRYGVKFVCFDNLQILCRNIEHAAQEANVISKEFKALAMELGIVIFLIVQPNRVREGEIVSARNAYGSSAIEKDVDIMLAIHRNREGKVKAEDFASMKYLEVEENFSPEMLVRADLTRYASGGTTTLKIIGAKSQIVEFSAEDKDTANSLKPLNEQIGVYAAA